MSMIINANKEEEKKKQTLTTRDRLMSGSKEEKAAGLFDVATKKAYSPLVDFPCEKTYEDLLQEGRNIYGDVGHFDWYLFPCHCRKAGILNFDIDEDEEMTKFFLNFSSQLFLKDDNLNVSIPENYDKSCFTKEEFDNYVKIAPDIRFSVCKKAVSQWYSDNRVNQRGIRFSKIIQHIDFTLRSLIYLSHIAGNKDMIEDPLKHCLIFVKTHIIDPYKNCFEKEINNDSGSEGVYSLHDAHYKTNVYNLLGLFNYLETKRTKNKDNFNWVDAAINYMNQPGNESFKPGFLKNYKDKYVNNSVPKFTVKLSESGAIAYDPKGFPNHATHHGGEGDHVNPNPPSGGISFTPEKTSFSEGIKTPLSSKSSQQHKLHEQKYLDNKKRDAQNNEDNTRPSIIIDDKQDDKKTATQKNQLGLVLSVFFAVVVITLLAVVGVTQLRGNKKSDTKEINNEVKNNLTDEASLCI